MTLFHIRCDVDSDATGWDEILFKNGFEEWLNEGDPADWTPPPCRVSNVRITKLDSEEPRLLRQFPVELQDAAENYRYV